jgi:hypothetical protein
MQMIECPNCGKLTGFKRSLGFGTFFMVVLTCGFWLLAIPFYPMRCITCGLTRSSAVLHNFAAWYRSLSPHNKTFMNTAGGILLLIIGVMWFNGARNSAVNYDDANAGSDESRDVNPTIYSVAEVQIARNRIPTGTKLTIKGIYGGHAWEPSNIPNYDPCFNLLAYGRAGVQHGEADPRTYCRFFINVQDETPPVGGPGVECNMSLEELKAAIAMSQNSYGDRVLARGTYASSLHFVSYSGGVIGIPVLDDCTLASLPPPPAPQASPPSPTSPTPEQMMRAINEVDSSPEYKSKPYPVDGDVEHDVQQALNTSALKSAVITPVSFHRVVTISGTVADEPSRELAEEITSQVSGVVAVHNNLIIGGAPAPIQSGTADNAQRVSSDLVTRGQTSTEVLAILGPPASVTMGAKSVYTYPNLKVVFVDGKVSEIQHF